MDRLPGLMGSHGYGGVDCSPPGCDAERSQVTPGSPMSEVARMEFRQLRYFVTLAEELRFGRVAGRQHIVQSALSQQSQRLERELGPRLLERTTHHVQLTPAGTPFLGRG